jgi:ketosteroid isomerase-like protein
MKTKNKLSMVALLFCFILFSCKEVKEEKTVLLKAPVANLDSMNKAWQNGWNTQNIEALKNLIADNAVVFMYNWKLQGKDSIMKNWINQSAPNLRNLTIDNFKNESTSEMAFSSGYYSYEVVSNDSVKGVEKGAYTLIWKLQNDHNWKMEALQFTAPK